MSTGPTTPSSPGPAGGSANLPAVSPAEAASRLDAGQVVLIPTETVFGLAASATSPAALGRLWGAASGGRPPDQQRREPLAWHVDSASRAAERLGPLAPVHARLLERLAPGPVLFAVRAGGPRLGAVRAALGVAPGVMDDGSELLLRVPSHAAAREVLRRAASPIVVAGVMGARKQRLTSAADAAAVLEHLKALSFVDAMVAQPPPPLGRHSTLVRLLESGGYEVAREGLYDAAYVARRAARNILFVCTGNTCRSPMAEAIARHLIESRPIDRSRPPEVPVVAASAGLGAWPGAPATPEAVEALRQLGISMGPHASRPLTREMLEDADQVFTMTRSHADAARDMAPEAATKITTLDPSGNGGADIQDPIGSPLSVYLDTARTIQRLIEARLREAT